MEWMENDKEKHEAQLTGTKEGDKDDLDHDAWSKGNYIETVLDDVVIDGSRKRQRTE